MAQIPNEAGRALDWEVDHTVFNDSNILTRVPNYSTNKDDTRLVLKQMEALGYEYKVFIEGSYWVAYFIDKERYRTSYSAHDHWSVAICLAAIHMF